MEPIEYKTITQADDLARMLKQLNELGAQGWEVCAEANARTGPAVIGRVDPRPRHESQVLLLKRRKEA